MKRTILIIAGGCTLLAVLFFSFRPIKQKIYSEHFTSFMKNNHYADSVEIRQWLEFIPNTGSGTTVYEVTVMGGRTKNKTDKELIENTFNKMIPEANKDTQQFVTRTNFIYMRDIPIQKKDSVCNIR